MTKVRAARQPNLTTVYWLLENPEVGKSEVFTVRVDAERKALPVFSFPDEAEMFLRLGGLEERGWRATRSTAKKLIWQLAEFRRAGIDLVALDPLPEMVGSTFGTAITLVTLSLHNFVERHAPRPGEALARS